MELIKMTRALYLLAGKLNLSIRLCYQKNKPDIDRLKNEMKRIKQLISAIELKIDSL